MSRVGDAEFALLQNNLLGAADILEDALRLDPRHPEALLKSAEVASMRGEGLRASEFFDRLIEVRPDHLPSLLSMARSLLAPNRLPDYERAAAALDRARTLAPLDPAVHLFRGLSSHLSGRSEEGIEDLHRSLELDPSNHEANYLLGVALSKLGRPAEAEKALRAAIEGRGPDPVWRWVLSLELIAQGKDPAAEPPRTRFIEVPESREDVGALFEDAAPAAGLDRPVAARGAAFFDYDGDGRPDLLVNSSYAPPALYRNEGGWRFTDVTAAAGLADQPPAWSSVAADFDNDGDQDLFMTRNGWFGPGANALLRNDGTGRFTDVAVEAGVADPGFAGFAASAADVDGDGLLDLYVANLFPLGRAPNRLFINRGGLRFEEVGAAAGVADPGPNIGCCFGDVDGDGRPDLFVAGYGTRSTLYRNAGGLRFEDVTGEFHCFAPREAFVSFFLDHDNDGDLDLFCTGFASFRDFAVSAEEGRPSPDGGRNALLRNDGGVFKTVTLDAGILRSYGTMAANFGDFDGNGNLDILLGNGGPDHGRREPNAAYFGRGGGRFAEGAAASGLRHVGRTHGIALADVDGDGLEDLFVATGGAFKSDEESPHLYRFLGTPLPSITLRLRGSRSNRDAVGARVTARRGTWRQVREVTAGAGFGCTGGKDVVLHPAGEGPVSVEVRWPSGLRHLLADLPPGRWSLAEDEAGPRLLPDVSGDPLPGETPR